MKAENIPVRISHRSKATATYMSELQVTHLSTKSRWINASKYLLGGLFVGAITALIPVLHFILVPAAIGVGLFLFYKHIGYKHVRSAKDISCPDCKESFNLKKSPFNWPMQVNCISCRSQLKIEPV